MTDDDNGWFDDDGEDGENDDNGMLTNIDLSWSSDDDDNDEQPADHDERDPWLTEERKERINETATSTYGWSKNATIDAGEWIWRVLQQRRTQLVLGALAAVVATIALVAASWLLYGFLSGIATLVGVVAGVATPWLWVRVARTPVGGAALSTAFFVLAQLTFGAGALVRRDDGQYEWRRLQQDGDQLYAELSTGDRVAIDGTVEELPTVAWAPLAIVEQKTEQNMGAITVDDSYANERPDPAPGADDPVATPMADGGSGWHIDASKLEHWVRGSSEAAPVREGLRKALEEKGGAQQLSQLVTMLIAAGMLVGGFVLGWGAMML